MRKILLVCLFIFIGYGKGIAQNNDVFINGFAVTFSGDTIWGEIGTNEHYDRKNAPDNAVTLYGIKNKDGKMQSLIPTKFKSFQRGKTVFISHKLEKPTKWLKRRRGVYVFLEREINGDGASYYSCFSYAKVSQVDAFGNPFSGYELVLVGYFVSKLDQKPIKLDRIRFREQLSKLFADNQEVLELINSRKYKFRDIPLIITTYNRLKNS